jgi:hypothetical protein
MSDHFECRQVHDVLDDPQVPVLEIADVQASKGRHVDVLPVPEASRLLKDLRDALEFDEVLSDESAFWEIITHRLRMCTAYFYFNHTAL